MWDPSTVYLTINSLSDHLEVDQQSIFFLFSKAFGIRISNQSVSADSKRVLEPFVRKAGIVSHHDASMGDMEEGKCFLLHQKKTRGAASVNLVCRYGGGGGDWLLASKPCPPFSQQRARRKSTGAYFHEGYKVTFGDKASVLSSIELYVPNVIVVENVWGFFSVGAKEPGRAV